VSERSVGALRSLTLVGHRWLNATTLHGLGKAVGGVLWDDSHSGLVLLGVPWVAPAR
jgi:hypothetical protein